MASETLSIDISATQERVWQVIADVESWPQWTKSMTTVKRLDNGPLRFGSRARIKQPGLPNLVWQVTDLTAGAEFTWVAHTPGVETVASHRLEQTPAGVRLTLTVTWTGVFAGAVAAIAGKKTRGYLALETAGAKGRAEAV
ncbi:polyketide cyclase [Trebonia kvetii]|uniref:Polyketide cyclase n=1 Tax=Trebonia kvetii TaxID=2480626 RepID=A0A6P2BMH2_9ACTN|nr:polyketide cyclase [Trebonia kvetii]